MFESIELKRVKNGFIVTLHNESGDADEFVFDTIRKAIKFIKDFAEAKPAA